MEWLSFRLNLLSNFVFGFSLVLLVTLPEGTINPSEFLAYMFYHERNHELIFLGNALNMFLNFCF